MEEFANIQLEFALAQQSDLMIMGNSGYGEVALYIHSYINTFIYTYVLICIHAV